ncbi:MAG: SCO family protein [Ottowia sp.]|nr:SCO family protein [Ottowia sp.]
MKTRRFFLKYITAGSAVALASGALLSACSKGPTPAEFHSVDITGADYAADFRLTDVNGQTRTLSDFAGQVVVIFFGYTQCPDVCPTTMMEMAQVKQALGDDGDKMQVLFVSLDPERDTPEVLKAYMGAFDPDFVGLVPDSDQELQELARNFKIFYERVEGSAPDTYTIDHTAASYVYDPKGRLRLFARYGASTQDLAEDFRQLLAGA